MSFESRYRFNRYNLVFAPFAAVNNHRSCVTFGVAFLWNEKKESYIWLFKTFLKAMCGVVIRLQRIYNFLLLHAIILYVLDV